MQWKILALATFVAAATSASPKDFHQDVLVSLLRSKVEDVCPRDYAACVAEPDCKVGIGLALQDFLLAGGSGSDISRSFQKTDLYKCADAKDVFSSFRYDNVANWHFDDDDKGGHEDDDEVESDQYLAFFELFRDEAEGCPKRDQTYANLNRGEYNSTTGEYAKKFDFDDEDAVRRAICLDAGCLMQTIDTPLFLDHIAVPGSAGMWDGDDMDDGLLYAMRNVTEEDNYNYGTLRSLFHDYDDYDNDDHLNDLAFYGEAPSCGCETGTFFNHDVAVEECDQASFYSQSYYCEKCHNFIEASDCANDGLPEKGAEECAKVCFGGKAKRKTAQQAYVDKLIKNGGFESCFPLDFAAKLAQTGFSYDKFRLKDAECNALQGDPAACKLEGCASNELGDELDFDDQSYFTKNEDYAAKVFRHIESFAEEAGMSSAEFTTKHFHECEANPMTAGIVGDETVDDYDDDWGEHSEQHRKHELLRSACESVLAEVDDDNNGNDDALPEWWYNDDGEVLQKKRCDATPGCSMQHLALPKTVAFRTRTGFEAFYKVHYADPEAKVKLEEFGDGAKSIMEDVLFDADDFDADVAVDQMGQLAEVVTAAATFGSTGVTNYPALLELRAVQDILSNSGMPVEALPKLVTGFEQWETDQEESAAQEAKSVCSDDYIHYGDGVEDCNRGVSFEDHDDAYGGYGMTRRFCSNDYSKNTDDSEPGRCMACPRQMEYAGVPNECACKLTYDDTTRMGAGACLVECFGFDGPTSKAALHLDGLQCPSTKKEAIRVDWDTFNKKGGYTECLPDNYAALSAKTGFSYDNYATKSYECPLEMTESDCVARDCDWNQDDDDDGKCEASTGRHGIVAGTAVSPAQRAAQKDLEEKTEAMILACVDPTSAACAKATEIMKESLEALEAAVPEPAFNTATGLSASLIAAVVAAATTTALF